MRVRHLLLMLLLFCLNGIPGQAQWMEIGSGISATPRLIFSISVVNEDVVWAVPLNSSSFTANFEFTRTTNSGESWNAGMLPNVGNYYPGNIFALDENMAWVIMINIPQQDRIKILKTENGGATWQQQAGEFNNAGHAFGALHFFNADEGIGFGSPGTGNPAIDSIQIFRTNDGGEHWGRIPSEELPAPLPEEGVWLYSGNCSYDAKGDTLWFVTRAGRVFRTTDKGVSWEAFSTGITGSSAAPGLTSIAFENSLNGIAVTMQPNQAARTTDGGLTWHQIAVLPVPKLAAIEYIPGTEDTYVVSDGWQFNGGANYLLITEDGGDSWDFMAYPPSMVCIQFISPTVGYGGGANFSAGKALVYKWTGDFSDPTTNGLEVLKPENTFEFSPNPAAHFLNVGLPEASSHAFVFQVFDAQGKMALQQMIQNGEQIEVRSLPPGMYWAKAVADGVVYTGKFVKR